MWYNSYIDFRDFIADGNTLFLLLWFCAQLLNQCCLVLLDKNQLIKINDESQDNYQARFSLSLIKIKYDTYMPDRVQLN